MGGGLTFTFGFAFAALSRIISATSVLILVESLIVLVLGGIGISCFRRLTTGFGGFGSVFDGDGTLDAVSSPSSSSSSSSADASSAWASFLLAGLAPGSLYADY